jgi:hypothetical protein
VTAELGTLPEQTRQRLEELGTVDLVIGLVEQLGGDKAVTTLAAIRQGLANLANSNQASFGRTVVAHNDGGAAGVPDGLEDESLRLLRYSAPVFDPSITLAQGISNAYRAIWGISGQLNARACVVIASGLESVTPEWIHGLAQPILERDFDLVAPCYAPQKFEGLLNSAILYPMTRAVYGKQLQNPLGPDFGLSARVIQSLLQPATVRARGVPAPQFVLIGPTAIVRGFKVCQTHLGRRIYPPPDWKNLDSILASVLGPLFMDMERDAPFWQHIRRSEAVPTYGERFSVPEETVTVDLRRLLEPFQLGFRNLQEIWSLVLPPGSLLELRRVHRLAPEEFRFPDELWARIVYDFALAYRLRTIARDHLLRAMTPLYLGWVAGYALEVEASDDAAVQKRSERLCAAFESGKPYLVSRWRWPDRFNP